MPRKQKQHNRDFQTWWIERFFNTESHPLYKNFKDLCGAGAEPEYLYFLCSCLKIGDRLTGIGQSKAKEIHQSKGGETPPPVEKENEDIAKTLKVFASTLIESTLEHLRENKHVDASVDTLALIPPEERQKLIDDAVMGATHIDLLLPYLEAIQEAYDSDQRMLREEEEERERELFGKLPVLTVIQEYQRIQIGKGRKADHWGSLFLLAVTEHLREKGGKPNFRLASGLLNKFRRQSKTGYQDRSTAKVRVQQLQTNHPRWQDDLETLKAQFRGAKPTLFSSSESGLPDLLKTQYGK